jgi:abortive infection bacteriophage resistance protein
MAMRTSGGRFFILNEAKMKYHKPPLTFKEQCKILQSRGLIISDESVAIEALKNINYYRLSAYFAPFQTQKDVFKKSTTLNDILSLYEFDRRLCLLLTEPLAEIEISIRTQVAYYLSHKYGPFGYTNHRNFYMRFNHPDWLRKVEDNIEKSHEVFIKHFRTKYKSEEYLPIWMVCEIISFGQISQLFRGLMKHDRQAIARGHFGIDQMVMVSWLHTLVYVRNLCAHHCRIWNRTLSIRPKILHRSSQWQNIQNEKIYCIILVLKHLMRMQQKWDEWVKKLLMLLNESLI